jgi:hypothetical protein
VWFSDAGDPDTISDEYFTAESNTDRLQFIDSRGGQIYLVGRNSTEVWYNDGVTPFSRLSQGLIDSGAYSVRSPEFCPQLGTFIWLDERKRIIKINGMMAESVSPTLDMYLQRCVSDDLRAKSSGHCFTWDGIPFYLFTAYTNPWGPEVTPGEGAPEEGMTVVVNLYNGDWYEWTSYISASGLYLPFQASSICDTPYGVYVGDASDGLIHKMVRGGTDENSLGVSAPMIRSDHIDRGDAGIWKKCKSLTVSFHMPYVHMETTLSVSVLYSDDGGKTWSTARTIAVAVTTGTNFYSATSYNWGRYKTRQWRVNIASAASYAIGPIIEDFEYLS